MNQIRTNRIVYLPLVLIVPCGVRRTRDGLLIASAIVVQQRAALVAVLMFGSLPLLLV